jgi:hypothetical protein
MTLIDAMPFGSAFWEWRMDEGSYLPIAIRSVRYRHGKLITEGCVAKLIALHIATNLRRLCCCCWRGTPSGSWRLGAMF